MIQNGGAGPPFLPRRAPPARRPSGSPRSSTHSIWRLKQRVSRQDQGRTERTVRHQVRPAGPRAPGNRTAGLAAPGRPLAALSSVASQPGWLPPPPCQGLPGSPFPDPASYYRALLHGRAVPAVRGCRADALPLGPLAAQALDQDRLERKRFRPVDQLVEYLVVASRRHPQHVANRLLLRARLPLPVALERENAYLAFSQRRHLPRALP